MIRVVYEIEMTIGEKLFLSLPLLEIRNVPVGSCCSIHFRSQRERGQDAFERYGTCKIAVQAAEQPNNWQLTSSQPASLGKEILIFLLIL